MPRRCKECKTEIPPASKCEDFIGKKGFCSVDCASEWSAKAARTRLQRDKAKSDRKVAGQNKIAKKAANKPMTDAEHKAAQKAFKEKDRPYQWKLTVRAAQKLGRLLDKGKGCISCERPDNGEVQFCGGHYRTKGGNPEIALDIRNIMGQCNKKCNRELSGNIYGTKTSRGYRSGIVERYGEAYLEWLDSYHEPKHYSCHDLIQIRKEYNSEIRRLEKGLEPSNDWRKLTD